MNRILVVFILIFTASVYSQNLTFGIAYQYQKAFEWEKMINNYNSNSPWLIENQPYLNATVSSNLQYIFGSKSVVHHGVGVHYNWSRSYADNVDSTNRLDMHQFTIGYILELDDEEKLKNFFFDFGFNFSWIELVSKFTKVGLPADLPTGGSSGIGGNLDVKFGYKVAFGPNAWMSPFIGGGYSYAQMGDLWNFFQTDGLSFQNNHIVYAKVGIQFEFSLPQKKKD